MISVYDMVYDTLKICPDKSSGIARDLSRIALKNKDLAKLAADEIAVELNDFVLGANRKYATNFVVDSAVVDSAALDHRRPHPPRVRPCLHSRRSPQPRSRYGRDHQRAPQRTSKTERVLVRETVHV